MSLFQCREWWSAKPDSGSLIFPPTEIDEHLFAFAQLKSVIRAVCASPTSTTMVDEQVPTASVVLFLLKFSSGCLLAAQTKSSRAAIRAFCVCTTRRTRATKSRTCCSNNSSKHPFCNSKPADSSRALARESHRAAATSQHALLPFAEQVAKRVVEFAAVARSAASAQTRRVQHHFSGARSQVCAA